LKQGLCVGVGSTIALLLFPAHNANLNSALLTILITFPLAMGGGWFGSQLLPPIVIRRNVSSHPKVFS
jgi:hypothetical protein